MKKRERNKEIKKERKKERTPGVPKQSMRVK